jgi:hypothetical protein
VITIYVDETYCDARRVPAAEFMLAPDSEHIIQIDLGEEITLSMPTTCAEYLRDTLDILLATSPDFPDSN